MFTANPYLIFAFALLIFLTLSFRGHGYWAWLLAGTLGIFAWVFAPAPAGPFTTQEITLVVVWVALAVVFGVPSVRRWVLTRPIMAQVARTLPRMSETEKIALDAGTVGWEGDLFHGTPDWSRLLDFKIQPLNDEERAFLDGPVTDLCHKLDDWDIANRRDLPQDIWTTLKTQGFFGIIIPKEYGGLGFSAQLHSAVVSKIASRSVTAAVTVMVPNSLGPGELLLQYGTQAQKDHFLPRLANGREIPCFALTEPNAGSDAANGKSRGVVCRDLWDGEEILGIRLSFDKRYITLAPVATVIGLAFRLFDPDHLIGTATEPGITCVLIPRDTAGVVIGSRHDPMGVPFQNGPVQGQNVFIPLDFIIGGQAQAGNGWRMLMEALASGRGISLPSLSVGAAQLACRATTAYAQVREQFGLPIGKFEGVAERIARIGGYTYMMDAVRTLSAGSVDAGERPSVASAIAKAYLTEGMRVCLNDAMDIHAGSAISRGPRNIFSRPYISIPIGITVEGANILTRSLIVFGQGAMRCHPFAHAEMQAIADHDLAAFDAALFGHINHVARNGVRALVAGVLGGVFFKAPSGVRGVARHYRALSRLSAAFAFTADLGLITLGGALKRKEALSGRYADAFAGLFLASATLKRFHDDGAPAGHQVALDWALTKIFDDVECALHGVLANLPNRTVAFCATRLVFPLGRQHAPLTDAHSLALAKDLLDPDHPLRKALSANIYIPDADEPGLGALEDTLKRVILAKPARDKLDQARRRADIAQDTTELMVAAAIQQGLIRAADGQHILDAEAARDAVVQVDSYDAETFHGLK